MRKRNVVRVILSQEHREILNYICSRLGQSESETMRKAFLDYAERLNVVSEKVHGRLKPFEK